MLSSSLRLSINLRLAMFQKLLIHTVFNLFIDLIAIITVPLYIYFFIVQLRLIFKKSNNDEISPVFTSILLWNGVFDIAETIITFVFIELPQQGIGMDWFSQDDTIKGKFLMVTELWGSFECCFIVIVLAVNRYTAVMCPVRYRTVRFEGNVE